MVVEKLEYEVLILRQKIEDFERLTKTLENRILDLETSTLKLIPDWKSVTPKQLEVIQYINTNLGYHFHTTLKEEAQIFIQEHIAESKRVVEQRKLEPQNEIQDMLIGLNWDFEEN